MGSNLPDEGFSPVILGYLGEYCSWNKIANSIISLLTCSFENRYTDFELESIRLYNPTKLKREVGTQTEVQSLFCIYTPIPQNVTG